MVSIYTDDYIQCLEFINNGLNLIVGYANGTIALHELKTLKLLSQINNAHEQKYDEGVNCLLKISKAASIQGKDSN